MNYKDYKKSRDLAWQILIDEQITKLPVPIVQICRDLNIVVKYDNKLTVSQNSGNSTIIGDEAYIMIDPACSKQRKRFTIAHELGHILLGHVGKYELVNREPSQNDNPHEQAANVFASRLLAPACVLKGCNVQSAVDIAKLCDISLVSAEYRYKRYSEILRRDKFNTSVLERKVSAQFAIFIQDHQHQA